jgi:hypothetical protein
MPPSGRLTSATIGVVVWMARVEWTEAAAMRSAVARDNGRRMGQFP